MEHVLRLPEERVYVALLTNCTDPNATPGTMDIANMIAAIVLGEPFDPPERQAAELSAGQLAEYVGTYRIDQATGRPGLRHLTLEDGRLLYGSPTGDKTEIIPESETAFFVPGRHSHFTFEFDDGGRVSRMTLHTGTGRTVLLTREE